MARSSVRGGRGTFDMSGVCKRAKHAGGRPLNGRVGAMGVHGASHFGEPWEVQTTLMIFQLSSAVLIICHVSIP
jgi:hypothetical protein